MIITRSPLRITLGGGGTDLPSYYRHHGGFLVSAAIDKYVYVSVNRPFAEGIFLKYSQLETADDVDSVKHPIIRESLRLLQLKTPQVEISSVADIPAGTGLGSSGSFTTALLKALYAHRRRNILPKELAALACHVELDLLREPIGKQDQFISAIGGITSFAFNQDDSVTVEPLGISVETLFNLEDNLLLFFTGFTRSASGILKDQKSKSEINNKQMLDNLNYVKELGYRSRDSLLKGEVDVFGALMHEHWEHKKRRSDGMSNSKIDDWYELGIRNGAIGGKLVGAGGGGFLMFVAHDRNRLRRTMINAGLEEVRFKFDFEGTKIVMSS
jgi:D-glycero-alpha-D-manno-heptose-7-phosphate kinase